MEGDTVAQQVAEAGWELSTAAESTHKYCNSPAEREPRAAAAKSTTQRVDMSSAELCSVEDLRERDSIKRPADYREPLELSAF
ncbi:unnamed protein product [Arctogadus glacialis]